MPTKMSLISSAMEMSGWDWELWRLRRGLGLGEWMKLLVKQFETNCSRVCQSIFWKLSHNVCTFMLNRIGLL